jgi:cell wall assembly regulator SMI1
MRKPNPALKRTTNGAACSLVCQNGRRHWLPLSWNVGPLRGGSRVFEENLRNIDRRILAKAPKVAAGLRPGAQDDELALLKTAFFDGKDLPRDLETFFRWHDGQTGYESLSPLDNRMLMSIAEVIDTWEFLSNPQEDVQQPWDKGWIPLLANGAGDYVVYVAGGEREGQLLSYRHDDSSRPLEFSSIDSWAKKILVSYEK